MTLIEKLLSLPTWQEADAAGGAAPAEGGAPVKEPPPQPGAEPAPDRGDAGDDDDGDGDDILGSGSDDDRKVVIPVDWPEDWRVKLAGEDEKLVKRLERFKTPNDLLKSWQAAEQKISSGEYKKALTEAETDEEKAELRKEYGIPDDPTGYELPEELSIELDAEDPGVKAFLEQMHGANATPDQVKAAIKAYDQLVVDAQERQVEADKAYRIENEDALRAEWGNEYRPKIEVLKRMVKDEEGPIPNSVMRMIATARDADGNRIINNREVAQMLVDIGVNHYGEGALLTGEQVQATANREQEIMHVMKTDFDKYFNEVQSNGKTMATELAEIRARKR